jgi:hypothetical protein
VCARASRGTQGFLTANRQEVCRKHSKEGWALDDVVNLTKVVNMEREEVRKGPDEGVYIYGLFLDGCRWDKSGNKLADSVPKVLFAPLPVLLVTGQLQSERKLDAYSYSAPCYKNKTRRGLNFIFPVVRPKRSKPWFLVWRLPLPFAQAAGLACAAGLAERGPADQVDLARGVPAVLQGLAVFWSN